MIPENKSRREFILDMAMTSSVAFLATSPWLKVLAAAKKTSRTANNRVRLAVIGTGSRGLELLNNLLPIVREINTEIIALCDDFPLHLNQAFDFCKQKGFYPATYSDYRVLLERENLDGIIIATPLAEHAHITLDCLSQGLHVFCEKAMARTLNDVRRMYDAFQSSRKVLQIGHQRMFNPIYLEGIRRIRNGEIGKIGQMRGYWHRNSDWRRVLPGNNDSLEKKINWRLYKELSAGLLTEIMSHQLQVANWVMDNNPISVTGTGSIIYWKDGRTVDDNIALIFSYVNGTQFIYDSMTSNRKYGLEEQIMGDKATIEFEMNRWYTETLPPAPGIQKLVNDIERKIFDKIAIAGSTWVPELASTDKGEPVVKDADWGDTQIELEAFVAFIRQGSIPLAMVNQAYYTSVWTLLAEQAIDSGHQVTISERFLVS